MSERKLDSKSEGQLSFKEGCTPIEELEKESKKYWRAHISQWRRNIAEVRTKATKLLEEVEIRALFQQTLSSWDCGLKLIARTSLQQEDVTPHDLGHKIKDLKVSVHNAWERELPWEAMRVFVNDSARWEILERDFGSNLIKVGIILQEIEKLEEDMQSLLDTKFGDFQNFRSKSDFK